MQRRCWVTPRRMVGLWQRQVRWSCNATHLKSPEGSRQSTPQLDGRRPVGRSPNRPSSSWGTRRRKGSVGQSKNDARSFLCANTSHVSPRRYRILLKRSSTSCRRMRTQWKTRTLGCQFVRTSGVPLRNKDHDPRWKLEGSIGVHVLGDRRALAHGDPSGRFTNQVRVFVCQALVIVNDLIWVAQCQGATTAQTKTFWTNHWIPLAPRHLRQSRLRSSDIG